MWSVLNQSKRIEITNDVNIFRPIFCFPVPLRHISRLTKDSKESSPRIEIFGSVPTGDLLLTVLVPFSSLQHPAPPFTKDTSQTKVPSFSPLLAAPCPSPPTKEREDGNLWLSGDLLLLSLSLLRLSCEHSTPTSNQRHLQPKTPPTKEREDGNLPAAVFHADKNFTGTQYTCKRLKSHFLQINKYNKMSNYTTFTGTQVWFTNLFYWHTIHYASSSGLKSRITKLLRSTRDFCEAGIEIASDPTR